MLLDRVFEAVINLNVLRWSKVKSQRKQIAGTLREDAAVEINCSMGTKRTTLVCYAKQRVKRSCCFNRSYTLLL